MHHACRANLWSFQFANPWLLTNRSHLIIMLHQLTSFVATSSIGNFLSDDDLSTNWIRRIGYSFIHYQQTWNPLYWSFATHPIFWKLFRIDDLNSSLMNVVFSNCFNKLRTPSIILPRGDLTLVQYIIIEFWSSFISLPTKCNVDLVSFKY